MGKVTMVQNGNWGWSQISEVSGNTVAEEDVHFLPIYMGVDGEEEAGIAIGTENFLSVNSQASGADQQASIDFANWLFTSEAGTKMASEDLRLHCSVRYVHRPCTLRSIGQRSCKVHEQ